MYIFCNKSTLLFWIAKVYYLIMREGKSQHHTKGFGLLSLFCSFFLKKGSRENIINGPIHNARASRSRFKWK